MKSSVSNMGLVGRYLGGQATREEAERLEALLLDDPQLRADFLAYARVDAAVLAAVGEKMQVPGTESPDRRRWLNWAPLAAAAAVLVLAASLYWNRESAPAGPGTVADQTVARVLRIEGEVFVNASRALSGGDELGAGEELTMKEGLVELVFNDSGVHVIATAPLVLTVSSSQQLRLDEGEVKLHVPPQGIGFVVVTGERRITDLGTSFVVTARPDGSKVFVLDGQIAVAKPDGGSTRLMEEGEFANFHPGGETEIRARKLSGLPELSLLPVEHGPGALPGIILGLENRAGLPKRNRLLEDRIGQRILPLIQSGFDDSAFLDGLTRGDPLRFAGIVGSYREFPQRAGLQDYPHQFGWLAWYRGAVVPPQPGRYRFWGYADNHLLVAIDGKPVFEGSRFGSTLRDELGVARRNHPAFPCLNAEAGFASGEWVELGTDPVQLDVIFGEMSNVHTSGLLLVEREGGSYEETFWGQPKWPLFLTEAPDDPRLTELHALSLYLEDNLKGAFSIARNAVWKVAP